MKRYFAMAYLKWIDFLLIFLSTSTIGAIDFDSPTAKGNQFWFNNLHNIKIYFNFSDGSQLRLLLPSTNNTNPGFGFGFFRMGASNDFYLSVVKFKVRTVSSLSVIEAPPIVVWSANRNMPVGEDATLEFRDDGDLVLRTADNYVVWSTGTSGTVARQLHLDDRGDFRLVDDGKKLIWNSFDHPTDTWLPGQELRVDPALTSSISNTNFSTGMFNLKVSPSASSIQAYFNSDPPQMYRSIFPFHKDCGLYNFSIGFLNYSSGYVNYHSSVEDFQYIRLEPNGHLNLYQLIDGYDEKFVLNLLEDEQYGECGYPQVCGQYGICNDGKCTCPESSSSSNGSYFRPMSSSQSGFNCEQVSPLSCNDTKLHTFVDVKNVTNFNSEPQISFTDADSCKLECLKNCSCKAALFRYGTNIKEGNCTFLWQMFSLMADGKSLSANNNLAFIKVQNPSDSKKPVLAFKLVLSLSAILTLVVVVVAGSCYCRRKKKYHENLDAYSFCVSNVLEKFSFNDLKTATKNFNTELGKGGFGSVFAGALENGCKVAVKRLSCNVRQGKKEFLAEVKTLGSIHHYNLVRLVGYCTEKSNRILVYEYVCHGSLDRWIFHKSQAQTLPWEIRRKIIVGIAKGLEYLHDHCSKGIIHFDIKPQNILLDKDFNVKISDFGLSKLFDKDQSHVSTLPRGTPGYIAPELIRGKNITSKIDVYSFGVVMLEIICGRKNSLAAGDYLIDLVKNKAEENKLESLVDESNEDMKLHKADAVKVMEIAILCLQTNLYKRPSAAKVVRFLDGSMKSEPISDYGFLTMIHVDKAPAVVGEPCYVSPVMASVLSGPR